MLLGNGSRLLISYRETTTAVRVCVCKRGSYQEVGG